MKNKLFIVSVIINVLLLVGVAYLIFDLGAMKANAQIADLKIQVLTIQNQLNLNTQNIQEIINFINQSVKK